MTYLQEYLVICLLDIFSVCQNVLIVGLFFSEPIEITTFSQVNCISIIIKVRSTLDYFEES